MQKLTAVLTSLSFICAISLSSLGCYNTYTVEKTEFKKLERLPDGQATVTVNDSAGRGVVVSDGTNVFVRSEGGRRYPVTAFNFRMTDSQLVASDRDTLLALDSIARYEVDHLSTWKTVGLVGLGVATAATVITLVIITAGAKSYQ